MVAYCSLVAGIGGIGDHRRTYFPLMPKAVSIKSAHPTSSRRAARQDHAVLLEWEDGEPSLDFLFETDDNLSQILEAIPTLGEVDACTHRPRWLLCARGGPMPKTASLSSEPERTLGV